MALPGMARRVAGARDGNTLGALLMMGMVGAFTFNDAFTKDAALRVPLFEVVFIRGVAATLILLGIARLAGHSLRIPPADRTSFALRTVGELGATATYLLALLHLPIANVVAILQTLPLVLALSGAVFLKEPIGPRRLAAIGVGFLGALLIVRPGAEGFNAWSLAALAAVLFVTLRDLSTRRFSDGLSSLGAATLTAGIVTLAAAVAHLAFETWTPPPTEASLSIARATLFIVAGYVLAVMVMRVGDIDYVAVFRYSALLWAILLGWLLFDELPSPVEFAGATLIAGSGAYVLLRERKLRRSVAKGAVDTGRDSPY
ncbi:MAG: DMT family transporter [Alphaproteobacteria bacterium]|nr:MAG: DMT family transporter [Alphaproteobacteria bacterium]